MFDILNICVQYEQYYIKLYNVIYELYNVYMKKQLKMFKFVFRWTFSISCIYEKLKFNSEKLYNAI